MRWCVVCVCVSARAQRALLSPLQASGSLATLRHPWAGTPSASAPSPMSQPSATTSSPASELDAGRRALLPMPLACSLPAAALATVASSPALPCPPTIRHHTPRPAFPPATRLPRTCAGAGLGRFYCRSCAPPSGHPPDPPKREAYTTLLPPAPTRSPTPITINPSDCLACRACFAATASPVAPRTHTRAAGKAF